MANAYVSTQHQLKFGIAECTINPNPYRPFYDKIELPISMNQKQAQELFP
jgi:hypothetical protein